MPFRAQFAQGHRHGGFRPAPRNEEFDESRLRSLWGRVEFVGFLPDACVLAQRGEAEWPALTPLDDKPLPLVNNVEEPLPLWVVGLVQAEFRRRDRLPHAFQQFMNRLHSLTPSSRRCQACPTPCTRLGLLLQPAPRASRWHRCPRRK